VNIIIKQAGLYLWRKFEKDVWRTVKLILDDRFNYSREFYEKCEQTLDTALRNVPHYRKFKSAADVFCSLEERFAALPPLTKEDMRNSFPKGLMPEGKNLTDGLLKDEVEYTFTSGTTSEKVVNIWNQDWWKRSEAASWKLNSKLSLLEYPQKQCKLASSLNVGISCEEDLPVSHRILGDTLYLNEKTSILQWQERHLKRMVNELNEYRPVILEANPSLLARLAYWIADTGTTVFSPKVIVFTFEFPSAIHLLAIRKVFSSDFVSSYGSTETGFVMEQCENGLMHQNTDFCRIDFVPFKPEYGLNDLGRIFVTSFDNAWNYIIKFDVGDIIRLNDDKSCVCGRSEGIIAKAVEGRVSNLTFDLKGIPVTTKMLDDSLSDISCIRDYHLEQTDKSTYKIEAMLSPDGNGRKAAEYIKEVLEKIYGNGNFLVNVVDDILPGPAGKFRRTQANFDFGEGKLFL